MKKFISILLALMLVMSLGTVAFAADGEGTAQLPDDVPSVTLVKDYTLDGDAKTAVSPAENFKFNISLTRTENLGQGADVDNIALPEISDAVYDAGAAGSANSKANITIVLPTYKAVGIYTYTITETSNNIAGVTYRTAPITLKVTVINGAATGTFIRQVALHAENPFGNKADHFEDNTYSAGKLTVTKQVIGDFGDKSADYTIHVKFHSDKVVKSDITYTGYNITDKVTIPAGDNGWNDYELDISLKHDSSITFANLPYGVTYEVSETAPEGYNPAVITYTDNTKKVDSIDADTVTVTNEKPGQIETGISLDSLPYILMLVVVGAAIVVVSTRKKGEQF